VEPGNINLALTLHRFARCYPFPAMACKNVCTPSRVYRTVGQIPGGSTWIAFARGISVPFPDIFWHFALMHCLLVTLG
jgi:hypothetical protein